MADAAVATPPVAKAVPAADRKRSTFFPRAIGGGLLGLAGIVALAAIFFLQTPNGTLRVEINDPSIEVHVKGSDVVLKQAEQQEITLSPGEHALVVKRGDFSFETRSFALKKGETTTVKIDLLPGKVQVALADGTIVGEEPTGAAIATADPPATDQPISGTTGAKVQYALDFAGDTTVITPLKFDGKHPFTIEAWATPEGPGFWPEYETGIICHNMRGFCLQYTRRNNRFFAWEAAINSDGWVIVGSETPIEFGVEAHVALVYDGKSVALFVGGNKLGEKNVLVSSCDWPLSIGGNSTDSNFRGRISQVRVSKSARYTADFTPTQKLSSDAETLALYCLDEGRGRIARDHSSHRQDAKICEPQWKQFDAAKQEWIAGPPGPLPGLLAEPSKLAGMNRWNIATRYPPSFGDARFSPDSTQLAVEGADGYVRILKARDFALEQVLPTRALQLAWSPNGKHLLATGPLIAEHGGYTRRVASLWSTERGVREQTYRTERGSDLHFTFHTAWNPDSNSFATTIDGLRIFGIDGELIHHFGNLNYPWPVDWSSNGKWIAVGEEGCNIRVFDATTGDTVATLKLEAHPFAARFSPDSTFLAATRFANQVKKSDLIRVWKTSDWTIEREIDDQRGGESLTWHPNNRWLAKAGGTLTIWDVRTGASVVQLDTENALFQVDWNKDGTMIASRDRSDSAMPIAVFDLKNENWEKRSLPPQPAEVQRDGGKSTIKLSGNKTAIVSDAGEILSSNAAELEDELIYLVERDDGSIEILRPSEFPARVARAKLQGDTSPSESPTGDEPPAATGANKPLYFRTPDYAAWEKAVAAMSAEEQVDAVSKKLVELNPEFDGKPTPTIEEGKVTGLHFCTDNVTDISPVRILSRLKSLECCGREWKGILSDLSPLRGMALEALNCNDNLRINDLSPLRESPLTSFYFGGTSVSDLSPLRELPLKNLSCYGSLVSDLSPLRGMSLKDVDIRWTPVGSLTPLKGMSLRSLNAEYTPVSDLSPLQGMPLTLLNCVGTQVTDLSPLKGMKLNRLECWGTAIADLTPLQGMKLERLSFSWTPVSNLSPLEGMPLKSLGCFETDVSDLTPLSGAPLEELYFTPRNIVEGIDVIRQSKSLTKIATGFDSGFGPAEFWQKYDAAEFGETVAPYTPITDFNSPEFKEWVSDVAKLPADKQVVAVSKKLVELNPGFDGQVTPTINGDLTVTGVQFRTDKVADISPVRALAALESLNCSGSIAPDHAGSGLLRDLSPLQGMRITNLSCYGNPKLRDLTPLQDLPLTFLDCSTSRVTDLSPLGKMPLNTLRAWATRVADLTPLKGLKLTSLELGKCSIYDLSPLEGMQLSELGLAETNVSSIAPLQGMRLNSLKIYTTRVSNIALLEGMPLTSLYIGSTRVSNIAAVQGMPLVHFDSFGTHLSNLSPLKDAPLKSIICDFDPERDAATLRSMKSLETINGKPVGEVWKEREATTTESQPEPKAVR